MSDYRFSDNYAWSVAGIDSDGERHALATFDEAEAVALWWCMVDTHDKGFLRFYADNRTLWLDNNTRAVVMERFDLAGARRLVDERAVTRLPARKKVS